MSIVRIVKLTSAYILGLTPLILSGSLIFHYRVENPFPVPAPNMTLPGSEFLFVNVLALLSVLAFLIMTRYANKPDRGHYLVCAILAAGQCMLPLLLNTSLMQLAGT